MKERILHFPSGAKVIFEGNLDPSEGYTLYIWPEDLYVIDEMKEVTEEDWEYLKRRFLERSDINDLSSKK